YGNGDLEYVLKQTCISVQFPGTEHAKVYEHQRFYIKSASTRWTAWEEYGKTADDTILGKITEVKSSAAVNKAALGFQRKNLLKNTAETKTINGVTFTVNEDGSVTVNGTAAATTNFHLNNYVKLEAGRQYILTGCPEGGDTNSSYRLYGLTNGGNWVGTGNDTGSGSLFTAYDFPSFTYRIIVYSGATVDNLTFYPMIRDADITDSTFEPYTESVVERLDRFGQQELLYSIDSAESPLTVNIPGLFKNYSAVICQINTSTYTMRYNLTLPLKYIKSLGTGSYYSADSQLMFEYVDDNNIKIITGMAQSNPTISNVKIIGLY
ncbi:MAG: hypothetical protein IJX24_05795, partial [Oscillospiraceae bacterium]|nr:hypothetical protein [Oscillospiraceae bacterium]